MGTRREPGFLDLKLTAKINGATTSHHVKVGFSVDKIMPYTKEPADFTAFWQKEMEALKSLPLNYTIEPAHEYDTDKADAYLVRLEVNKQRQCIYGYLFIPKAHKKGACPIVICPPGAGVKTIKEPLRHRYYADNGCIRFETEIHGLDPRMTEKQFKEISAALNTGANGYLCQGLDSREHYYMKHVYLGLVRAVDFLTSLPEWDGKNVAVQGGSQGGALSLVLAALDSRVTLCCANHPALADMAAYREKGRTGGYPHMHRIGVLNDTAEKTLFSADGFGKFGVYDADPDDWACEARRYYFNICGKYGAQVAKVLQKAAGLDIQRICPLHGPVLTGDRLAEAVRLYTVWSSYKPETPEGILIAYASIHGNTAAAARRLANILEAKGAPKVAVTDLCRDDVAEAIADAFRMGTMVLACSTYDGGIFPPMKCFLDKLAMKGFCDR